MEMIRRVQINHVKTLLRETDLKLGAIPDLAGFSYIAIWLADFAWSREVRPDNIASWRYGIPDDGDRWDSQI